MVKLEKSVWVYILIVFILTYSLQIIAITQGGEEYEFFPLLIACSMFIPGIGALIYLFKTKDGLKYINWRLGKPLHLIVSLLFPALLTLIGILLFEKTGLGVNHAYTIDEGAVHTIDIALFLGSDDQGLAYFLLNFLITGIGFSIIQGVLAFGEEIGWRGFLQKKLLERNSLFKSLTFLGLLWGFWHFPLIANGFNFPEYPLWGAFLIFPLMTVFVSYLIGWLTLNSKSVWPAVFLHGGINSIMIFLFEMDFGEHKFYANFAILGIWIIIGCLAYKFIYKKSNRCIISTAICAAFECSVW